MRLMHSFASADGPMLGSCGLASEAHLARNEQAGAIESRASTLRLVLFKDH
jgi:hypothetical protein